MITSILDNDLYKFSTSYAYMKLFPNAMGTFTFYDRNHTKYTKEMVENIKRKIYHLSSLIMTPNEVIYMKNHCPYIPSYYFDWLHSFSYNVNELSIEHYEDGTLSINATGLLYRITLWEIPILAIVSEELANVQGPTNMDLVVEKTKEKAVIINNSGYILSDFGTRRRESFYVQNFVVKMLSELCPKFVGTSNCFLAMQHNLKPIGTHPHEWFMFHGAMYGYEHANYMALENWVNVYDGDLGIALSDTYTSDLFFKNFSKKHAKLFDGVRQDSGDPFKFIDKTIKRYNELNVDPLTKTIVFSDSLTVDKAAEIARNCQGRIKCSFGIGTHLTNDFGKTPANIVMKLSSCQMTPNQSLRKCVKLSDSEGKHTGDPDEVALALLTINQHK